MNKDRAEGKVKDIAGRVERQVGEWTDNPKMEVNGAAKQAEGKVQNAWGKPEVVYSERGAKVRDGLGIGEGHVTLTDEAGLVVAVAILMRRAAP